MSAQLNPTLLLLVPLAPLAGALLVGLFGTRFFGNLLGRKAAHTVAILGVLVAFGLSIHTLFAVKNGAHFDGALYTWMAVDGVRLELGFLIDSLGRDHDVRRDFHFADGACLYHRLHGQG